MAPDLGSSVVTELYTGMGSLKGKSHLIRDFQIKKNETDMRYLCSLITGGLGRSWNLQLMGIKQEKAMVVSTPILRLKSNENKQRTMKTHVN